MTANKNIYETVEKIGYLFGYFLFTTILYFILVSFKNVYWDYFYIMGFTLLITVFAIAIRRLLK